MKFKNSVRIINGTDENIISVDESLQIDTVYRLNYGKYSIKNFPDSYNLRVEDKPFLQLYGRVYESSSFLFMSFKTGKLPMKQWEYTNLRGKKSPPQFHGHFLIKKMVNSLLLTHAV